MKKSLLAFLLLGAVGVKAQGIKVYAPDFRDTMPVIMLVSYCDSCPAMTIKGIAIKQKAYRGFGYSFYDRNGNRLQFVWNWEAYIEPKQ